MQLAGDVGSPLQVGARFPGAGGYRDAHIENHTTHICKCRGLEVTTSLPNLIGIWGLLYQSPGHEDGYGDIHFHGIKVVVHLLKINTLALIIDMAQLIISAPRPGMKLLPPPIQEREYTPRTKRARSGQSRATEGACGWQPQPRQLTRGVVSTRPPPPRKLWALTSCIHYPMLRNKLPQNPAAERKRVSF